MPQAWTEICVFISSTFRDMQAERDHLVRFVRAVTLLQSATSTSATLLGQPSNPASW
ncbi:MAG TPA: DUF4062 domain-containing protein [Thermoanaerobaculia bacterium]|nr:DUF4062 domain-containing protein [Thermoanaerobaculia bacterium]